MSVSASQKLSMESMGVVVPSLLLTPSTAVLATWLRVCLATACHIFHPFSCQMGSPVIRYMYQTDSIASGLRWESKSSVQWSKRNYGEDKRNASLPQNVSLITNPRKSRREALAYDQIRHVLLVSIRLDRSWGQVDGSLIDGHLTYCATKGSRG